MTDEGHTLTCFENLGRAMKSARKARKLTASDVADKLGVATETVFRWESGDMPSGYNLWRWAKTLEVNFDAVMSAAFEPTPSGPHTLTSQLFSICAQVETVANNFDRWRWGEPEPEHAKLRQVLYGVRALRAAAKLLVVVLTGPDGENEMLVSDKSAPSELLLVSSVRVEPT